MRSMEAAIIAVGWFETHNRGSPVLRVRRATYGSLLDSADSSLHRPAGTGSRNPIQGLGLRIRGC